MRSLYPARGRERACRRSDVAKPTRAADTAHEPPYGPRADSATRVSTLRKEHRMLWLVIGVVLLIIAIAGGHGRTAP
jgi:hypothetical protein